MKSMKTPDGLPITWRPFRGGFKVFVGGWRQPTIYKTEAGRDRAIKRLQEKTWN